MALLPKGCCAPRHKAVATVSLLLPLTPPKNQLRAFPSLRYDNRSQVAGQRMDWLFGVRCLHSVKSAAAGRGLHGPTWL